jgi:hypothetical protein
VPREDPPKQRGHLAGGQNLFQSTGLFRIAINQIDGIQPYESFPER